MSSLLGLERSDTQVVLRLSGSPENVRTARLVAVATARRANMSEGCIDEVRIGVGEAVTWAIQSAGSATVEVVIAAPEDAEFSVSVRPLKAEGLEAEAPMDTLAMALLTGLADQVSVHEQGVTLSWDPGSWT